MAKKEGSERERELVERRTLVTHSMNQMTSDFPFFSQIIASE